MSPNFYSYNLMISYNMSKNKFKSQFSHGLLWRGAGGEVKTTLPMPTTHKIRLLLSVLSAVCAFPPTVAGDYAVSPGCPDFTDITAPYAEPMFKYSNYTVSDEWVYGRGSNTHEVITKPLPGAQDTDIRTGGLLPLWPPGEERVVRLGDFNSRYGVDLASIIYHFTVEPGNPLLLLKYAVVLEDPDDNDLRRPRFTIRVSDKDDRLIDPCAEYSVLFDGKTEGFRTCNPGAGSVPVRWLDWTTAAVDLSAYAGQEVQVRFTTAGIVGRLFGYAYFTASCVSNRLQVSACRNGNVVLEAPGGFASYLWDNGDRTPVSARAGLTGGALVNCTAVSVSGCRPVFYGEAVNTLPPEGGIVRDTLCEGSPYDRNGFLLPPQFGVGVKTHYKTYFSPAACSETQVRLRLAITHPGYFHIRDAICEGEDYTGNGFSVRQPPAGIRRDTIFSFSPTKGCDSIVCLELTVNHPVSDAPGALYGPSTPCVNDPSVYSFAPGHFDFEWEIPEGVRAAGRKDNPSVTLLFGDTLPRRITLKARNGCGTYERSLEAHPHSAYTLYFADSICAGTVYNGYGFSSGVIDSAGYYTFTRRLRTIHGCDSTIALALRVFGSPELSIRLEGDSVLCAGRPVALHAMGAGAVVGFPPVSVGDILCTDNSIVTRDAYLESGKTAMGVVFYVDESGEHGWAVGLDYISGSSKKWGKLGDIPELGNCTDLSSPCAFDGYNNTRIIREAGDAMDYPLAWAVDFPGGWYIPAVGQLHVMATVVPYLKASLEITGGSLFNFVNSGTSFSSSQYNANDVWMAYFGKKNYLGEPTLTRSSKTYSSAITRIIRSF